MNICRFIFWLEGELVASRYVLIKQYEEYDRMRFMEIPNTEKKYLDIFGEIEEKTIRAEIECELLEKKQEMIQTAINRREPIDEAAIDAIINEEREKALKEAQGEEPQNFTELTLPQQDELQNVYNEIVKKYHPQMHPELTEAHKELFRKAQDAYRRRDLPALCLIKDTLDSIGEDENALELFLQLMAASQNENSEEEEKLPEHKKDYTLAGMIYKSFVPTADEAAIIEETDFYKDKCEELAQDMEKMRNEFPLSAKAMLEDPEETEKYKEELSHRLRDAEKKKTVLEAKISSMLKEVSPNG